MATYQYTLGIYSDLTENYPELQSDFDQIRKVFEEGVGEVSELSIENILEAALGYMKSNLAMIDDGFESLSLSHIRTASSYLIVDVKVSTTSQLNEDAYIDNFLDYIQDVGVAGVFG